MDKEMAGIALGLLRERKEILSDMLLMTQVVDLSKGADSVGDYVTAIEKREELLGKIKEINEKLSKIRLDEPPLSGDTKFQSELKRISDETRKLAGHIVDLDKSRISEEKSIQEEIKKNLREIKAGKTVNTHYTYDKNFAGGNYFDKSK